MCGMSLHFKTAALPEVVAKGMLDYPYMAAIRMNPSQYLFDFKTCIITAVGVDYTGSRAGPSFFNDNSPTVVNLSVRFKETMILTRSDLTKSNRGGSLTSGMGSPSASISNPVAG